MIKKWLILLLIIALICIITIIVATRNFDNFPKPTGQLGVGTMAHHLIDTTRKDPNNPTADRELMAQIWYPTQVKTTVALTPYDADALTGALFFLHEVSTIPGLFRGLYSLKTFSQPNAPISQRFSNYAVIVLSHGTGGMVQNYTYLAEELASHGFIVVGINHTYMAGYTRFPDGRVIESLAHAKQKEGEKAFNVFKEQQLAIAIQDIKFVLDSLEKLNADSTFFLHQKLDLDHIGICGHSAAGSLAMRMCIEEKRLKAGVSLNGNIDRSNPHAVAFSTPFLFIRGESGHGEQEKEIKDRNRIRELCEKPGMNMTVLTLLNTEHGTLTDISALLNQSYATQYISKMKDFRIGASSASALKAITIAKKYISAFFAKFLQGEPALFFEHPDCNIVAEI